MVWDVLEAFAFVAIAAGLFLLFGPLGLIGGAVLILIVSVLVNRPKRKGDA